MILNNTWVGVLEAVLRTLVFLLFTRKLFPEDRRQARYCAAAAVIFLSNLTFLTTLLRRFSGSMIRQTIMILAAACVLRWIAELQTGYAVYLAVVYILGLGAWFNVITPFTLTQLTGISLIIPDIALQAVRLLLGGLTLWVFRKGFIRMEADGSLTAGQTFLSVFPALVQFFVMLIFWYSVFRDETLVITDHAAAFAWLTVLLAFSSLATLVAANRVLFAQQQGEELRLANQRIQAQYEQFERQRQADEALRTLRHDMNNHLSAISGLLEQEGAARSYVEDLLEQTAAALDEVDTGDPTLNVVLEQKTALAEEKGVTLLSYVNWKQGSFVSPMDICTLFGNCIDNAIEAIVRDGPEDRSITVRGGVVANCVVVKFENSCTRAPRFQDGLPVTSKDGGEHGLGLRSVRRVLEKYNGTLDIRMGEGRFVLTWMIPLP